MHRAGGRRGGEDGLWDTAGHPEGLQPISAARSFSSRPVPTHAEHPTPLLSIALQMLSAISFRWAFSRALGACGLKAERCFAPIGEEEQLHSCSCAGYLQSGALRQLSKFVFNESGCALQFA